MSNILPGYNASTYNKGDDFTSFLPFLEELIPSHIKGDPNALFADLVRTYFRFMEQPGEAGDLSRNISKLFDSSVGGQTDQLFPLFRKENMAFLPDTIEASRRTVLNNIIQQYLAKGHESAVKSLFRIVYDEPVSITYPENRLYTSPPATINSDVIIRFSVLPGVTAENFRNSKIIGLTSNATAELLSTSSGTIGGYAYIEAIVDVSLGTFISGETIRTTYTLDGNVYQGSILSMAGGYTINNPGTGYFRGDAIPLSSNGDGLGFITQVGVVRGGIDRIDIVNPGGGFVSTPQIMIVGDGIGAVATANMSGGALLSVTINNPGTGYTRAQAFVYPPVGDPRPSSFPIITPVISGQVETLDIIEPGIGYTVAPDLDEAAILNGSGLDVTMSPSTIASVAMRQPRRFRGDFSKVAPQNYNVYMVMDTGTGDFTPGETVQQLNALGSVVFSGIVLSWDSYTHELLIGFTPLDGFIKGMPVVGLTSGASWMFGSRYSKPIMIDAGDGQVDLEYTYYMTSGLGVRTYAKLHDDNTHPAGLNYVGFVSLVSGKDGELYVGPDLDTWWIIKWFTKFVIQPLTGLDEGVIGDYEQDSFTQVAGNSAVNIKIAENFNTVNVYTLNYVDLKTYFVMQSLSNLDGTIINNGPSGAFNTEDNVEDSGINLRVAQSVITPISYVTNTVVDYNDFLITKSGEYDSDPLGTYDGTTLKYSTDDSGVNMKAGSFTIFYNAGVLLADVGIYLAINGNLDHLKVNV